jgi:ketosteroid isomerase-like protein
VASFSWCRPGLETGVGKEEEAPISKAEENKALVRHIMEARAKADLDAIEEMMAPDFISHGLLPGQQPGREGLKRTIAEIAAAFSNRRRFIED